eukprot:TRINITY_DN68_c0_g1_i5.p1 TRINITY_DN68_c0_g1~~TRINITY_DN68_c0_g1_i5.p1  ORF type:complete len:1021 (-),score=561.75 TRINITY_DN68_c0_g1_i5:637-3699(-)
MSSDGAAMDVDGGKEIDESLQSRQLAVYGRHAMGKLSTSKVLISGLGGLGCEIAKNVILANVGAVTLQDHRDVAKADLASAFYATEEDVGRNRATAVSGRLRELNPSVHVSEVGGELTDALIGAHDVVVLTDTSAREAQRVAVACRAAGAKLVRSDIRGVFGFVFDDFGDAHVVLDATGEQVKTAIVASISNSGKGIVACVEDDRVDFEDGDVVEFREVQGMPELKDGTQMKVSNVRAHSFEIGDTTAWGAYVRGGIVTEVKQPRTVRHRPLADAVREPGEFLESDYAKFGRSALLHALFTTLDHYADRHGRFPAPGSDADAEAFVAALRETVATAIAEGPARPELDEAALAIARQFASGSRATLNPLAAIFGGIAAQEVIKAITGKYTPLTQWFYYDCVEALPAAGSVDAADLQPVNSRYDSNLMVFGKGVQEKLGALNLFMVGAGALGCEFIKNFAMLGVACGAGGKLTLTDDDTIERSNLTRQFLFRNWMIGQPKSTAAATAVLAMNPGMTINALQDRVSPATEHTFDDAFWGSLDVVTNALDNMKARLYVDSRCVFFGKPLLESGTLGTKCNTQTVLPHKTENYGASRDPPEKQAPDCTLHNFPHTINHCLSWGRSEFIGQFEAGPAVASSVAAHVAAGTGVAGFAAERERDGATPREVADLLRAVRALAADPCSDWGSCVRWARLLFEDYFANRVKQLTHTFPEDAVTSSGMPFWSPPKRFPRAVEFDGADPVHARFISAAANLRAQTMGVAVPAGCGFAAGPAGEAAVAQLAAAVPVPAFVPQEGVKVKVNPNDPDPDAGEDEGSARSQINALVEELGAHAGLPVLARVSALEFEKDDDSNFHMAFIGAVGNLRARSYEIPEVDPLQAKLIAGRIIPAIATATALATGFVCLELLKLVQAKPMEEHRNVFANLALPLFAISEPMPAARVKSRVEKRIPDPINHPEYVEEETIVAYPEGHTAWDRLDVPMSRSATIQDVVDMFAERHGLKLGSIAIATAASSGVILYSDLGGWDG